MARTYMEGSGLSDDFPIGNRWSPDDLLGDPDDPEAGGGAMAPGMTREEAIEFLLVNASSIVDAMVMAGREAIEYALDGHDWPGKSDVHCTSCNGSGVRFPTNSRPLPPGTDRSCERCRGTKVEPATEGTP